VNEEKPSEKRGFSRIQLPNFHRVPSAPPFKKAHNIIVGFFNVWLVSEQEFQLFPGRVEIEVSKREAPVELRE
jgi:hypothetical protein